MPSAIADLLVTTIEHDAAMLEFSAPLDDSESEAVSSYEIRYMAGKEMTSANFSEGLLADITMAPAAPGELEEIMVPELLPNTHYWIGIRSVDECLNRSEPIIVSLTTLRPPTGSVDACFIATAAYGSAMANEVIELRHFRDKILRKTVLGEVLVESYYALGPNVATWMGVSESARQSTRRMLQPIIDMVKPFLR